MPQICEWFPECRRILALKRDILPILHLKYHDFIDIPRTHLIPHPILQPPVQLLGPTCSNPSSNTIDVAGGYPILSVVATGETTFWCTGTSLAAGDGEAIAQLKSDDGVWEGKFWYPTSGPNLGVPTWDLHNTATGENRTIWGENKPQVDEPAPDGSDISWSRRVVDGDTATNPPKAWYVLRTETTSTGKPKTDTCVDDQDYIMNFTARFTMISCDYYGRPPPVPAPGPDYMNVSLLALNSTVPAPAPDTPIPAPGPAPVVAPVPTPAPVPVPAPAPEPVQLPVPAPEPVLPPPMSSPPPPLVVPTPPVAPAPASAACTPHAALSAGMVVILSSIIIMMNAL